MDTERWGRGVNDIINEGGERIIYIPDPNPNPDSEPDPDSGTTRLNLPS